MKQIKSNYIKMFFTIVISSFLNSYGNIVQIRWGTTNDALNGVTITWSNTGKNDSIAWGYTSNFEKGHYIGKSRAGYSSPLFFSYTFSSILPDTNIYYKLWNSALGIWEGQKTYKTAPRPSKNKFSFAALGDCRTDPTILTTISNLVAARRPALSLFNGDLTLSGTSASEYNTFFSASSNFLENCLVLHAEGNHDAGSPVTFSNLWDLPITNGTNLYYAVRHGNALFITLNSCDFNGTMLSWLHNTLAAAEADTSIIWKIASFHHPFFTVGAHQGDMNSYRNTIWKEFDDHGVDILFNGHDHNYQRSKPVNLKISSSSPVASYGSNPGQGRLEIISGGAGASLYSKGSSADAWAINIFNSTYNYVYCDIDGKIAKITAYNTNNSVIDNVTLNKTNSSSTGLNEIEKSTFHSISIFPNPANKNFSLQLKNSEIGEATITISDEKGVIISKDIVQKSNALLEYKYDVSHFSKGIYNVSISINGLIEGSILIVN